MELSLDDSVAARRGLVEDLINKQMDPKTPPEIRDSSISWLRALEQALLRVRAEEEARPAYKPLR